jgi:ubiquitin C-terminal hydrolase
LSSLPSKAPWASQYFTLFAGIIRDCCVVGTDAGGVAEGELEPLMKLVRDTLVNHPIVEHRGEADAVPAPAPGAVDSVFIGLCDVISAIILRDPTLKESAGKGLVQFLVSTCLFSVPSPECSGPDSPPLCKSKASRLQAFKLLLELGDKCPSNYSATAETLLSLHGQRRKAIRGWNYAPAGADKGSSPFVGLKNLGATCYMNSLMQQFHMIPQFRQKLLKVPSVYKEDAQDRSENMLWELQSIFASLQESEKKFYDPSSFCKSYKYEGQPMNPGVQMDVDEFFLHLLDKLETLTKGTEQEQLLKTFFGGNVAHQIVSKECEHISDRDEPFYTVQVEVKNRRNLYESLAAYIQGDLLDGDNKYKCEKCNKGVDAVKRVCIGSLPNNLVISLKRFEFDMETMRRFKVTDNFEFPMNLNVKPYTREGLAANNATATADAAANTASAADNADNADAATAKDANAANEDPNYAYELTGVIVHMGTADSGHYYSFIKDRTTNQWYCFNDTSVEPFDPRKLPDECFGGYETTTVLDGQQKRVARRQNKYNSAYMLIYSKVIPTQPQVSTPVDRAQLAQAVPSRLYQTLWDDNLDFLRDRQLFDPDYFQFATQLLQLQANAEKEQEQQAYADAMRMGAEYGIKLLVETLVHAKEKEKFSDALGHLHALLSASPAACQWFLSTMLQDNLGWVKKMLWDCPVSDVRAAFAGLLVHALKTLAPLERQSYLVNVVLGADDPRLPALQDAQKFDMETEERMGEEYSQYTKAVARGSMSVGISGGAGAGAADATDVFFPPAARHLSEVFKLPVDHNTGLYMYPLSLVARFMDRYFSLLRLAHTAGAWRYFSEYFYVMEQFSLLGASERAYLNSRHVAATLVDYYMGVESPHSTGKRSKRDPNKAELQAVANMKHLIGTVSVLVRSSAFPRDQPSSVAVVSTSPAAITDPSASKDESLLPEPDAQWVQHKLFLSRAMSESTFVESMSSLTQHLVWDNASVSERIVELINNTVNRVDYGLFEPLFAVMSAVLELQEGDGSELHARRVTKAVTGLARVIEENLKYMKATQYAVRYLAELANNHAEARDFLFQSMKTWLPELSTYDKNERVRLATESIVLSFVKDLPGGNYDPFPQASQSQSVDPSNSTGANEVALMNLGARPQQYLALSVEQPLSPDSHAKLVAINKFLWEHVETIAHTRATGEPSMTAKTGDSFPPSFFRLRSLFRLIQWTLRTPELVENVQLHYPFLLKLVVAMDKNQYECDLNKLEIIRLLDLSTQLPSNLTALSNLLLPSSAVRGAGAGAGAVGDDDMDVVQRHHEEQAEASERLTHFYAYFISLRNTYKYIQYNEAGCVPFYRVINRLALHQPTLAVLCTEHRNWDWAIRWLCLDTLSYPESATELLGIAAKSARESQPFRLKGLSYAAKLMKEKGHTSSSFQPDNFVRYCRILLSSSSSTASVDGGDASTSMGTAVNVSQLPLAESLAFTDGGGHRTLLALFEYIDISSYIDGTDYVSPTTTEILDVVALALSWVEIAHHVPHNFGSGNSNAVLEQLDPVAAAPLLSLSTADPLVLHRIDKHRTNMVAWLNNGRTLDVLMDFIRRLDILSLRDARVAGLLLRIANVLRILMKLDSELVPPLVLPLVDEWLQFHEVSATSTSTSTSSSAPSEVEGSSGESSSILSFPAYALSEFIPNVISSSLAAKVSSASDPAEMNQRYTLAAAILLRSLQWAIQANNAVAVQALGRTLALHKDSGLAPLVGSQDKFLDVISSLAVIDSSSSSLLVALDGCHAEWASCLSNLFNAWANHQQTDPSSTSAVNKLVGLTVQWMHALSQQLAVPSSSSSSATIALANIVLASLTAICSSEAGVTALRERGPQVTDPATSIVQLISMREEQPLQQLKSTLDQVIASPPGSN